MQLKKWSKIILFKDKRQASLSNSESSALHIYWRLRCAPSCNSKGVCVLPYFNGKMFEVDKCIICIHLHPMLIETCSSCWAGRPSLSHITHLGTGASWRNKEPRSYCLFPQRMGRNLCLLLKSYVHVSHHRFSQNYLPSRAFAALFWTCSSTSLSFLNWGAQSWTQYSWCGLTSAEYRGKKSLPEQVGAWAWL